MTVSLDSRQRMLVFSLILLPVIAWLGPLERVSHNYLDQALANAGLIYATARGINAVISVIQTTEIDAAVMSVQVGQVLDPVNDLVERFSAVMLAALGSLALQKIILELVSDFTFNMLLSILAVAAVAALIMRYRKPYAFLAGAFWIVVFFRFSLVLVVLANSWIDAAFLSETEDQKHEAMKSFQASLEATRSGAFLDDKALRELEERSAQAGILESQLESSATELRALETELALKVKQMDVARQESSSCRIFISARTCSADVMGLKLESDAIEEDIETVEDLIASLEDQLEENSEALECLVRRSNGESCGLFDSVKSALSMQAKIQALESGMSEFVDSTVSLLMSLVFKTILIPLLFIYALIRATRFSARRFSTHLGENHAAA